MRCCSSVVEHSLGKGEVDSSILSSSTIFYGMARPSTRQRTLAGQPEGKGSAMQIAVLGIDLGKNSCSVVGLDSSGRVVLRRRLQRDSVIKLASGQ